MAIENPSVLYLEQSLSPEQKTAACENIGAVRTIAGKGLSTEDFTTAEKNKLSDVESGAEENVIDEITVNGTAVTPVNKSVEITIPNEVFRATYGVTTYNEVAAAFNAGYWVTCLNGARLATLTFNGADNYEFLYYRSRTGTNVDEVYAYKVKNDDTWSSEYRTVVPVFSGAAKGNGLVPASGASATTYLKGDGTWDIPTDTTYTAGDGIDISVQDAISVKTDGTTIHANASGELEVIGGGGGTTYTAGDGIDISAQNVISVKTDGTTIRANASGELEVIGGGGGGEMNVIEGVKLDGAASVLTPDASKNVTIPNAVATGETGATNGLMTADDKKSIGTAVQYKVNPLESGTPVLLAQQMYVVESDAQIISIAGQSSEIQGKGTIFFRVGV
jgi:hypothetical protein